MTTYMNGTIDDVVYAAARVSGCLLRMHSDGWRPDADELEDLADCALTALIWVSEVLTGVDEEGRSLSPADLSAALAILDEQRDVIQMCIRERIDAN